MSTDEHRSDIKKKFNIYSKGELFRMHCQYLVHPTLGNHESLTTNSNFGASQGSKIAVCAQMCSNVLLGRFLWLGVAGSGTAGLELPFRALFPRLLTVTKTLMSVL
jgi:hypothetical protein